MATIWQGEGQQSVNIVLSFPKTALRKAREYLRKLWVRVLAMGVLAIIVLGLSQLGQHWVPDEILSRRSGQSADRLLDLIAQAMLAVTTFSLTVMVTLYRASSTQFTPRVHQLIMEDRVTQNTLAAFIGAFVYALVGIVLRETGAYGDDSAMILFWMTVLVLAFIVWSVIRWVLHLQTLGSLIDTTRQLETITRQQFEERLETPCLGATPLTDDPPSGGVTLCATQSGYVKHIYPEYLQTQAQSCDVHLYFLVEIGDFVFVNQPIIRVCPTDGARETERDEQAKWTAILDGGITLGDVRTYDQDPRFGLMVMSEIASKALSPGVNDPGTAIDVINRLGRILSLYRDETVEDRDVPCPNLHVRPLSAWDLLDDGFAALARDGAGIFEVQHRLQAVLTGLMHHPDPGLCEAARDHAQVFLDQSLEAIQARRARERLTALQGDWPDPSR